MKNLQATLPGLLSAIQVAERGSFVAAAKALDLTPAAVSKNVAKLETALKVRLFNRTTRKLSLTTEGKAFLTEARAGLAILDNAAAVAGQSQKPQGLVRINCPVVFGRRYIVPALPKFYKLYPEVQLDLHLNDQAVDLVGSGFDIGIRGGSQPPEGMIARKIFDISSILVASPKYLAERGVPKTFHDLVRHDLLRVKFLNGRMFPWVFKDTKSGSEKLVTVDYDAKLIMSDPDALVEAALLHLGIAGVGSYHAFEYLKRGELVEVLPRQQRVNTGIAMSIFYPHRSGLAPRVRVLVDFLLDHFSKIAALKPYRP